MSKNKFFGNVSNGEENEAEVVNLAEPTQDELAEALSADDEENLGLAVVNENNNEVLLEANAIENLPFTAVSYFRNNATGHYHLVSIGYNPETGQVGALEVDPDRTAMDRNSIEEEFKISVVTNIFSR